MMKVVISTPVSVGKQAGERDAEPQDQQRGVGQHLLAHQQQPEDGGEGEEARHLAHALRQAGLEPLEVGALDREVVEQRRPARVAQVVDERQRPQEDDRVGGCKLEV